MPPNLGDSFQHLFQLHVALSEEDRNDTFRVRHDVYCSDLHWEAERPDGMETDAYDAHSIHCLIRTNDERRARVGCLRLVIPDPVDPASLLPLEIGCAETIDRTLLDPTNLDRRRIAEVSRLAITNNYRRRKEEQGEPGTIQPRDFGTADQPRFPFIPVGLYLAGFAVAEVLKLDHLLVLTEPRLAQHFNRIGFDIRQIGGPVEHRGVRVPSVIYPELVIPNFRPMLRPMWQAVRAAVRRDFAAAGPHALPWLGREITID
jgi:N-acyl amino acid synthase of PEP-CTERM/exosortase system